MNEATYTFRVDDSLKSDFTRAARSRDRSAAQILRDFMRDFVAQDRQGEQYDAWFRSQVEAGLAAADAGDLVSSETIEEEMAARRAATLRKLGGRRP